MFSLFCALPTFGSLSIFSLHLSGHVRLSILLLYKRKGKKRNCHHVWLKHICDCCRSIQTTVKIYNKNGCIYIDANKFFPFLALLQLRQGVKISPIHSLGKGTWFASFGKLTAATQRCCRHQHCTGCWFNAINLELQAFPLCATTSKYCKSKLTPRGKRLAANETSDSFRCVEAVGRRCGNGPQTLTRQQPALFQHPLC